jgi:hypothetical protein
MDTIREHEPSQAKPTTDEVKYYKKDELPNWIQKEGLRLLTSGNPDKFEDESELFTDRNLDKFKDAEIDGNVFVDHAGDVKFFKECNLSMGISERLAKLATIAGGETTGIKSKLLSFMSYTPRRQQANNVTGNRQQAEDVELSYRQSRKSLAPFIC